MSRPAVFLDRDGTIIEDRGHLARAEQVVFIPAAFETLRRLQAEFVLFIVTNQPGIAEGVISAEEAAAVNSHVESRLRDEGVSLCGIYVCPHRRREKCECIKPNPFFVRQAAEQYGLDLERSFVVGDHPHDVDLAANAGATGVYVMTGHGTKHLAEVRPGVAILPDIAGAASYILAIDRGRGRGKTPPLRRASSGGAAGKTT